jgi:hypothetical protein
VCCCVGRGQLQRGLQLQARLVPVNMPLSSACLTVHTGLSGIRTPTVLRCLLRPLVMSTIWLGRFLLAGKMKVYCQGWREEGVQARRQQQGEFLVRWVACPSCPSQWWCVSDNMPLKDQDRTKKGSQQMHDKHNSHKATLHVASVTDASCRACAVAMARALPPAAAPPSPALAALAAHG